MQIRSVGIDLGKTTFHLVALGASGTATIGAENRWAAYSRCRPSHPRSATLCNRSKPSRS